MARYSPNWAEQMMEPMETGEYVPVEDFERLRAALEEIADYDCDMEAVSVGTCNPPCRTCIARAALEGKP